MHLHLRLMIENEKGEAFMGTGLLQLLEGIEEEKSIARAARAMDLSYVKALRILDRLERNLRRKVVRRKKGGAERGGASLTPAGRQWVEEFRRLHEEMERAADRHFKAFVRRRKQRRKS